VENHDVLWWQCPGAISGRKGLTFVLQFQEKKAQENSYFSSLCAGPKSCITGGTLSVLFAVSEWTAIQAFFSSTQLKVFLHTDKPNGPG